MQKQTRLLNYEKERIKLFIANLDVPMTKPIKECINDYLKDIKIEIGKNSPEVTQDKSKMLFFLKMKRFIVTAYNNLYEMDQCFFDDKLRRLREELLQLEQILNNVHLRVINIEGAFESIFLKEQENYNILDKALEINKKIISMYISSEASLKRNLDAKEILLLTNPNSQTILEDVKKVRTTYADFSCEFEHLKNKTKTLNDLKIEFRNKYIGDFTTNLSDKLNKLEILITNILNYKAYELDYELWSKAKKSEAVRQFFKLSKIDGGYSSKTYLKYFLKNLDSSLISESQQELKDVLKYLEEITERTIMVVCKSESKALEYKHLIEEIDKDYIVKEFNRTFSALTFAHKSKLNLVILDNHLNDMDSFEFVKDFKEELPHKFEKVKFMILVDSIKKNVVSEFISMAVKPIFISNDLKKDELIERISNELK